MTMNVWKIEWTYQVGRKRPVPGDTRVIAGSRTEALDAFAAIHPDGATFTYKVIAIEPIALAELF